MKYFNVSLMVLAVLAVLFSLAAAQSFGDYFPGFAAPQSAVGSGGGRSNTGPVLFPNTPPGSETSGVVVGASGYGFVPRAAEQVAPEALPPSTVVERSAVKTTCRRSAPARAACAHTSHRNATPYSCRLEFSTSTCVFSAVVEETQTVVLIFAPPYARNLHSCQLCKNASLYSSQKEMLQDVLDCRLKQVAVIIALVCVEAYYRCFHYFHSTQIWQN